MDCFELFNLSIKNQRDCYSIESIAASNFENKFDTILCIVKVHDTSRNVDRCLYRSFYCIKVDNIELFMQPYFLNLEIKTVNIQLIHKLYKF